jgi:hypothetical protein
MISSGCTRNGSESAHALHIDPAASRCTAVPSPPVPAEAAGDRAGRSGLLRTYLEDGELEAARHDASA